MASSSSFKMDVHLSECRPQHLLISPAGCTVTRHLNLPPGTCKVMIRDSGSDIRVAGNNGVVVSAVFIDGPKLVKREMELDLKRLVDETMELQKQHSYLRMKCESAERKASLIAMHVEAQLSATCHPTHKDVVPAFADMDLMATLTEKQMEVTAAAAEGKFQALEELNKLQMKQEALASEFLRWGIPKPAKNYENFLVNVHQSLMQRQSDCEVTVSSSTDEAMLEIKNNTHSVAWECSLHVHVWQDARPSGYRASVDVDAILRRPRGETWANVDVQFVTQRASMSIQSKVPEPPRRKVVLTRSGEGLGQMMAHNGVASSSGFQGINVKGLTVPGDATTQVIPLLRDVDLPVEVFRFAVPDKEQAAYMLISLTNTSGVELGAGPRVAVSMNGTLVGHAHMHECVTPGSAFTLVVGPDPSISLTQEKVPDVKGREGMLFRNDKQELTQTIRLSGCGLESDTPIALIYAVPCPTVSTIKVTQKTPSEARRLNGLNTDQCVVEALQQFTGSSRETFKEDSGQRYIDVVLVPKSDTITIERRRVIEHPIDTKIVIRESF